MIKLHDKETGAWLGTISEEQLQYLIDQLEEESGDDQDYYLNDVTISAMEESGADAGLIALLRKVMGDKEEIEIRWSRAK